VTPSLVFRALCRDCGCGFGGVDFHGGAADKRSCFDEGNFFIGCFQSMTASCVRRFLREARAFDSLDIAHSVEH
jgi:hypothetical protein